MINSLQNWMERPSQPPIYKNRASSWDVETLRFQYAGELNPCTLETCSNDCPKRFIGRYLCIEDRNTNYNHGQDPSLIDTVKTGWKAAMRPEEFSPTPLRQRRLELQKFTPSFSLERSTFAVYARDRRKGKCEH